MHGENERVVGQDLQRLKGCQFCLLRQVCITLWKAYIPFGIPEMLFKQSLLFLVFSVHSKCLIYSKFILILITFWVLMYVVVTGDGAHNHCANRYSKGYSSCYVWSCREILWKNFKPTLIYVDLLAICLEATPYIQMCPRSYSKYILTFSQVVRILAHGATHNFDLV